MTATGIAIDTTSPFGTYGAEGLARFAWALADRHEMAAGLRKRVRTLVSRIWAGPYDTEADGLRFRLYPGSNYDDRKIMARRRLPERAEHDMLARHLVKGTVFVDIGANIGSYALQAARRGAQVLAVEANPETAGRLAFNVAANRLDEIVVATVAVGEAPGTMQLWSEPTNCGFATLVEDLTTGEWAGDWSPRTVTVRPLANLLAAHGIGRVDVLKVDVEGFEDRVLLPYLQDCDPGLLPRAVLLETNCREHWARDCLAVLAGLGYAVEGETMDNMLFGRAA
ncbi:FkbM family methyltransferase [Stappia sp.]|uniref:FkbM family methyltransferase n=1 Tax=Stappia sp. TaxID=1870903 RepID=UPI003D115876